MMQFSLEPFLVWLMIFMRTAFILGFFPLVGDQFIPIRIRIVTAAVVSLALVPVVPIQSSQFPSGGGAMVMMLFSEAILAMGLGLTCRVLFGIIQFSGQIAGEQMGFGIINTIDPTGSSQISVVAEMQYILAIMLFFTADLHHAFLSVISRSFDLLPPGTPGVNHGVVDFMMGLGDTLFTLTIQFAMPVIIIIFAINVALGLIARAVPQINVFLESFPLRIMAGVGLILISLGVMAEMWMDMLSTLPEQMGWLMRLMAG
jgi:flagellar biosynthetic protein FliR